jgi:hypothetical protein
VDAKEAIRRVLDGEVRVEVKDERGRIVVAYYRKADVVYVCDRQGERPIMALEAKPLLDPKPPEKKRKRKDRR